MMRVFIAALLLCFVTVSWSQDKNKKALIIANYDYDKESTGWGPINADADVKYIKAALDNQKFPENNVTVLENLNKQEILAAFDEFSKSVSKGDYLVIHYSGHGQQITDMGGEEIDGLDEAIIPIDAPSETEYAPAGYKGELHLTDDELNEKLSVIRKKIGTEGHILMLLDACHSGTATRGGTNLARGSATPFTWETGAADKTSNVEAAFIDPAQGDMGKFVLYSGASPNQLNYECYDDERKPVGSLSYSFAKAMAKLKETAAGGGQFTYRQLFAEMKAIMAIKAFRQDPMMEGDVDYEVFGGNLIRQKNYFLFQKRLQGRSFVLDAGTMAGVTPGSIVGVYERGVTDPENATDKLVTKGTVTNALGLIAEVELDADIGFRNKDAYWVFVLEKGAADFTVKVGEMQSRGAETASSLINSVKDLKVVEVVDPEQAEVLVSVDEDKIMLVGPDFTEEFKAQELEKAKEFLEIYSKGNYLKKLSAEDPNYRVEISLIPVRVTETLSGFSYDTLDIADYQTVSGLELPEGTQFLVQVRNVGARDAYFAILDIEPSGKVNQVLPNMDVYNYTAADCFVGKGKTQILNVPFQVYDPYGNETYKVIAAKDPINTDAMITRRATRGANARGNMSSLELLVDDTFSTRGSSPVSTTRVSSGSMSNFNFRIVPASK